ncbi:hypothetical protein SESBI_44189 [Sesbania bispinosa]|nr:hypothetical protein SESBI_44189 [Sesbania bispinosa]
MAGSVSCSNGSALIPKAMHSKSFFLSPIRIAVTVGRNGNNRISRLRVCVSMVDSSSDFVKRMEQAWVVICLWLVVLVSSLNQTVLYGLHLSLPLCPGNWQPKIDAGSKGTKAYTKFKFVFYSCSVVDNQGQLYVHLATQKGILNANGVGVLAFLLLVTTCFVKSHLETLPVSFALERDQRAALVVKEQAFVQSGWKNLLHPSRKTTTEMVVEHSF